MSVRSADQTRQFRQRVLGQFDRDARCANAVNWSPHGERRWAMPSEPLSRDHLLNDFRFVINDEMGVALNHRECFVSEDVGDFKQ